MLAARKYKVTSLYVLLVVGLVTLFASCSKDEPVKPPYTIPKDTTSHNFVWYTDTLGERHSQVNDIFCFSDKDALAVGLFYVGDSTGSIHDSLATNVAHWDGVRWTLLRVEPKWTGGRFFAEFNSVFAFARDDIWIGPPVHYDGKEWQGYDVNSISAGIPRKIWGPTSNDIWFAGNNGALLHWDGFRFSKKGYTTTAANRDVWGSNDTVRVATSDYDWESGSSGYVMKLVNGQVVDRELLQGVQIAVWGMDGVWYSGGCSGLYQKSGERWKMIREFERCITGIRGTALNNVFVAMEEGKILHFNGSTWDTILPFEKSGVFFPFGLAVNGNAVFLSGILNHRAIVYRGYQQ